MSPQDKIIHVANKLGLSTLKDMQGSTGAVYDADVEASGILFGRSAQHNSPNVTNLNDNRFEVNEALLIETIAVYTCTANGLDVQNMQTTLGSAAVVLMDVVIGNKTVIKDAPIFAAGQPSTFASIGLQYNSDDQANLFLPRHQIFMEGAGILIPPQVDFYINYKIYNVYTGEILPLPSETFLGAYLFGTKVNLNFNTSL